MEEKISTHEAIKGLGYSLDQIKRWRVLLFGVDQSCGKGRGAVRYLSKTEAFKLHVFGFLITKLRYTIREAKEFFNDFEKKIQNT